MAHLEDGVFTRWPLERAHYRAARQWLSLSEVSLPTLDALHVAVAAAHSVPLATCDVHLARVARTLGVAVHLLRT